MIISFLKYLAVPGLIVLTLFSSGCSKLPDMSNHNKFNKQGIMFSYPGNWKANIEEIKSDKLKFNQVVIESPASGILTIQQMDSISDISANEFASTYLKSFREEYNIISTGDFIPGDIETVIGGKTVSGVRYEFIISMLGARVQHKFTVHKLNIKQMTLFIITQAARDDWYNEEPGFHLIYKSLKLPDGKEAI